MGGFAEKSGEEILKHHHNSSVSQTLKRNSTFFHQVVWTAVCSAPFSFVLVQWLVWNILIFIFSVYSMQKIYLLEKYHKKYGQVCLDRKGYQCALIVSFDYHPTYHYYSSSHMWTNKFSLYKVMEGFCHKVKVFIWCFILESSWCHNLMTGTESKIRSLFVVICKMPYFSKINDSFFSSLQRWILSHPHVTQSLIINGSIELSLDYGNGGKILNNIRNWFSNYLSMIFT